MRMILYTFKVVMYSTLLSSVMAAVILLFRAIFKERLGLRWNYYVWMLLVIRLLIPYGPKSSLSIFNLTSLMNSNFIRANDHVSSAVVDHASDNNEITLEASGLENEKKQIKNRTVNEDNYKPELLTKTVITKEVCFKIASAVWFLGMLLLGVYNIIMLLHFNAKLNMEKPCEDKDILAVMGKCRREMNINKHIPILKTDMVKSPAVFGCIQPRLLMPKDINEQVSVGELRYIFLHELAHVKRMDITVSLINCFLQIIHWFNPIIWYSFYRMRQDRELACDALALSYMEPDEYIRYGNIIIKLLESYVRPVCMYGMACVIDDKSQIKRRITMISLFKKNSYKWTILPVIILIVMGCILLTNGKGSGKAEEIKNDTDKKVAQTMDSDNNSIHEYGYDTQSGKFKYKIIAVPNPKKIVIGFSKQHGKGETTSNIAMDNNAIGAVNAGAFKNDISGKCEPSGIIIHDGKVVYSDLNGSSEKINVAAITDKGVLLVGNCSMEELNKVGAREAVSSVRTLIVNGKPQITEGDGGMGVGPRTAIGQKKDGTILLITIDGRSKDSAGATLMEVQDILIKNEAYNAANLDGGSSSTMFYNGKIINHPCDAKGEREITSAFVVLR